MDFSTVSCLNLVFIIWYGRTKCYCNSLHLVRVPVWKNKRGFVPIVLCVLFRVGLIIYGLLGGKGQSVHCMSVFWWLALQRRRHSTPTHPDLEGGAVEERGGGWIGALCT